MEAYAFCMLPFFITLLTRLHIGFRPWVIVSYNHSCTFNTGLSQRFSFHFTWIRQKKKVTFYHIWEKIASVLKKNQILHLKFLTFSGPF